MNKGRIITAVWRAVSKVKYFSIAIAILFVALITFTVVSMEGSIYGDEYMFIRITEELPNCSTSATWLTVDHPELTSEINSDEYYRLAYDTEVWIHPLLPNYLMYPLFKVINPMTPSVARSIPLVLTLITALLIADIIRRKFNLALAGLSVLPFLFSMQLLGGGLWLYYDCFMWAFFALSLWLIYAKPDTKWVYLTMAAMLMSKETGLVLIIPLMLAYYSQTYKLGHMLTLLLPALVLVGWQAHMGLVTGDALYYWRHWQALKPLESNLTVNLEYLRFYLINWGGIFYFVLTLPGLIANIKNEQWWPFICLYLMTLCMGILWGIVPYHMFSMLFPGMAMMALSIRYLLPHLGGKGYV